MDVLNDGAAVRLGELKIGEVPDSVDTVVGKALGDGNGGLLGNGENGNVNMVRGEVVLKLVHRVDGDAVKGGADYFGLDIEGGGQIEAPFRKAEVIHQSMADVADTDEDGGEASVHTEDRCDLRTQRGDIISVTLLAEFAEAAEILTNLRRGQPKLMTQLEGRDAADAVFGKLIQLAEVAGQTPNNII